MTGRLLPVLALAALLCSACSSPAATRTASGLSALPSLGRVTRDSASGHISHVVVIIQENRSFENFFAGYPGANAPTFGYAGSNKIDLHPITFKGPDITHSWGSSIGEWDDGKMDGFNQYGSMSEYDAYAYVKRSLIKPYWDMAQQYVLSDAMFPTEFGGSFTAHLTLVAGTDDLTTNKAEVDVPTLPPDDCDAAPGVTSSYVTPNRVVHSFKGPFPCFDQWNTMAQVLDGAGVSWKYYATELVGAGMWSPFEGIKYVRYGPDWTKNVIAPQTTVLTDPKNGQLASVSWVSPSEEDSDHPESQSDRGPSWVASVVNAIGESSYWNSTAIVVLWDDWGGWYDNAPPPQLDYRGLGIRVPCIIISPYAKKGYVDHTQYEYGSILKFIEETFGLPAVGPTSKGYTDTRAASLDDAFDFTQKPRAFKPFKAKYDLMQFVREPRSYAPVDTE